MGSASRKKKSRRNVILKPLVLSSNESKAQRLANNKGRDVELRLTGREGVYDEAIWYVPSQLPVSLRSVTSVAIIYKCGYHS